MRLQQKDFLDKHKNKPAVIAVHGPNLDEHKQTIEKLQKENKILRFSVNNWFDYFDTHPDYWVTANGEFTIESAIKNNGIWSAHGYPKNIIYETTSTILFADSVDFSDYTLLEDLLKCDFHGYDQRHFKNRSCVEIVKSFKNH